MLCLFLVTVTILKQARGFFLNNKEQISKINAPIHVGCKIMKTVSAFYSNFETRKAQLGRLLYQSSLYGTS